MWVVAFHEARVTVDYDKLVTKEKTKCLGSSGQNGHTTLNTKAVFPDILAPPKISASALFACTEEQDYP